MKNTVIIIGPDKNFGQGGVATVINNQCVIMHESDRLRFEFIESHGKKRFTFLRAFYQIVVSCLRKNQQAGVYWFHTSQYFSIFRKCALSIPCFIFRKKIIFQLHSIKIEHYLNNKVTKWLLRLVLSIPDKIVVLSPFWLDLMVMHFPTMKTKFVELANPVIETDIPQEQTDFLTGQPYILSLSRLVKGKGIDKVIASMTQLTMDLVIAGQGDDADYLRDLCKKLNVEHKVHFVGWVNGEQKKKLIASAKLFVLPSKYDSFGMVFVEAMALAVPVVAFNIPTVAQVVKHQQTGLLINNDDPKSLVNAIDMVMLNHDEMALNARAHVLEHYSSVVYKNRVQQLISSL